MLNTSLYVISLKNKGLPMPTVDQTKAKIKLWFTILCITGCTKSANEVISYISAIEEKVRFQNSFCQITPRKRTCHALFHSITHFYFHVIFCFLVVNGKDDLYLLKHQNKYRAIICCTATKRTNIKKAEANHQLHDLLIICL